jgi:hypothetical protein
MTFGEKPVTEITTGDIEAYRHHRRMQKRSAVTSNHDLKLLRKMFTWGIRERLLTATPFKVAGEAGHHSLTTTTVTSTRPVAGCASRCCESSRPERSPRVLQILAKSLRSPAITQTTSNRRPRLANHCRRSV